MVRHKTDEQLKTLARDMHAGRVFTNRHIQTSPHLPVEVRARQVSDILGAIFTPLMLMDEASQELLRAQEPMLFYAYLDKAGPRSVNGYPQFMEVYIVTAEEWPLLERYIQALEAAPDPLADLDGAEPS